VVQEEGPAVVVVQAELEEELAAGQAEAEVAREGVEVDRQVEVAAAVVNPFATSGEHSAGRVAGRIFFGSCNF
jgi:hypothetical protein